MYGRETVESEQEEIAYRRAFSLLYETEHAGIVQWIIARGGARDDAVDLAQEAFVRVWAKRREVKNARSYLYEIVKNALKNYFKHADIVAGCDAARLPRQASAPKPDEVLAGREMAKVIEATLVKMPDGPREVLRMHIDGMSIADVARERGQDPAAVRVR